MDQVEPVGFAPNQERQSHYHEAAQRMTNVTPGVVLCVSTLHGACEEDSLKHFICIRE